jgi:hypothetical protein
VTLRNKKASADFICGARNWLRGLDLNQRPSGYEPDELPGCSTPRSKWTVNLSYLLMRRKRFRRHQNGQTS